MRNFHTFTSHVERVTVVIFQGFRYSRSGNPTRKCLEAVLASLERALFAPSYSSGLAATTNIVHLLKTGDLIDAFDDLFCGVSRLFRECGNSLGIEVDFVDARDPQKVADTMKPNTKVISRLRLPSESCRSCVAPTWDSVSRLHSLNTYLDTLSADLGRNSLEPDDEDCGYRCRLRMPQGSGT